MKNSLQTIDIKMIKQLSEEIYDEILKYGIDTIKELFSTGDTLQEKVKLELAKEYLKRMLVAQMDLDGMLLTHKYYNTGFDGIAEFREESDKIKSYIQTNSTLSFNEATINALFGNSLNITSEGEYENWKELVYRGGYQGKDILTFYAEEKFKVDYESNRNPIRKFLQSFKYKKLFKQDTLEDSYINKVRGMLREYIIANPNENTAFIITESRNQFEQGISEYKSLQELENISKITLTSLQQPEGAPIDIEETCSVVRGMMQEMNPEKFKTEYRKRQVTLGTDHGINAGPVIHTIPFKEVPKAIQDLQQRYDEAYTNMQTEEEYIKEIAKIYADFIYIQPYEDGNKRTATCLLNSMLLSRGILPPPISLMNNEQMAIAFDKAKYKDYTMLQDMILKGYDKMKSTVGGSKEAEILLKNEHRKDDRGEETEI